MPAGKPSIAILGGTGREGTGLALRWAAAGYTIIIGSRDAERAQKAAEAIRQRLGIDHVSGLTNSNAARKAEISVLTVVQTAHQEALESLGDALQGKILVDATSRVDYKNPAPPLPPSAGEHAQKLLGSTVKVVAAFQNIPSKLLTQAIGEALDADALVCSDDMDAAEQVVELAKAAGMRGYYAGRLANANVVEGLSSVLISLNRHYGVKDASIKITGISE